MTSRTNLQTLQDGADATRTLGHDLINTAEHALQSTREMASKGLGAASEASARAQKQLGRYADMTGRYVADQPMRSVLIAAAAGAVIAALLMATRRR